VGEGSGEERLMSQMPRSVKSLLANIVDYAGLFPPAKLDMPRTVRNYARYLQSDENWMMGRLIVPVARLGEFERDAANLLPKLENAEPWLISALTVAAADGDGFARDLVSIEEFNIRYEGRAAIDVIEIKSQTAVEISDALDQVPDDLFPFFELPIDRDPRGLIASLADGDAGAKVRTGGTSADSYPKTHDLARFIASCASASSGGVPFKATAGLHHPLRHFSSAVNTKEFGFFNVFIAGGLAYADEVEEPIIRELLEESSIEAFTFADDHIAWRDWRLMIDDIEAARDSFAVSFGSCSFDEPIEDLKSLKLL
jgi:hypothetical protein